MQNEKRINENVMTSLKMVELVLFCKAPQE
jgi:hypothetical protein